MSKLTKFTRSSLLVCGAFFLSIFLGTSASAASIQCAKAVTFVEKTICGSKALNEMDTQLNNWYLKHLAQAERPQEVVIDQREWLEVLRQCNSKNCIRNAYAVRLAHLGKDLSVDTAGVSNFKIRTIHVLKDGWSFEVSNTESNAQHTLYILMGSENAAGAFHDQHAARFKVGAVLMGVAFYEDEMVAIDRIEPATNEAL